MGNNQSTKLDSIDRFILVENFTTLEEKQEEEKEREKKPPFHLLNNINHEHRI